MAITTTTTEWTPDEYHAPADQILPDALILRGSTVVTSTLEGDEPVVRIPWVRDDEAEFVAEGEQIEQAIPETSSVSVGTSKVSQLLVISREAWHHTDTARLLQGSTTRAVLKKADQAFLTHTPGGSGNPLLTGITNTAGIITGGGITADLDPLADAVAQIENNGGQPALIIANPLAWGSLRNLKVGTGSNAALLGSGTDDQGKRLLGVEVVTNAAVPEGQMIVLDPTAVASAVGPLKVASSEHAYFAHDSVGLRVTWRIGWGVQHPDRIATVGVDVPAEG